MLQFDISDLPSEVKRELVSGRLFKQQQDYEEAMRAQAQLAAETPEARSVDGVGRLLFRLDPRVFHYWNQREGNGIWGDKSFQKEMLRDNPELRIRCHGTKTMVGYSGEQRKYHKNYGTLSN
jgi:hypothetical protein